MALHLQISSNIVRPGVLALSLALGFAVLTPPKVVSAQDAYSCIEELSDEEVTYRIKYIEKSFRDGKKGAAGWRYGWLAGFLVLGGGFTYLALDFAREGGNYEKRDWDKFAFAYLAAGAYFNSLMHLIIPAPDVWGAKRIRRQADGTEEERRAKLRYATERLEQSNGIQGLLGGPFPVVGGVMYGVVGGSVKAAKWPTKTRGVTAAVFLIPPFVNGLAVATAPKTSVETWENYRGIACSSQYYQRGSEGPDLDFSVGPAGGSFTVKF